jgi:hypothetical protein
VELDFQIGAILTAKGNPGDEGLGIDLTPVGKARPALKLARRLDEGTPIDWSEQA